MRKWRYSIIIISLILLVWLTGCRLDDGIEYNYNDIRVINEKDSVGVYSINPVQAIEIEFAKDYNTESVQTNPGLLTIQKDSRAKGLIAFAKETGLIRAGERLLTTNDLKPDDIVAINSVPQDDSKRASYPLPDGFSVIDTTVGPGESFELSIAAKAINGLSAVEWTMHYDSSFMRLDPDYASDQIVLTGVFSNALPLIEKTGNTIDISVALNNPIDISEETVIKIRFETLSKTGDSTLYFTDTTALDETGSVMSSVFTSGKVTVTDNLQPVFLGDFNQDDIINIYDFSRFAQHYNTNAGEGNYNVLYDIGPAQDYFQGEWSGIYDKPNPDGKVDILDFSVFATNYGESKPPEFNYPPTKPANPKPVTGAKNTSVAPTLEWEECTDPEGDAINYRVYMGTNPDPSNLIGTTNDPIMVLSGLEFSTTYYWKVIAEDSTGNTSSGDIWRFETKDDDNLPPSPPTNPSPQDLTEDVATTVELSWGSSSDPEGGIITYDLYLSSDQNPALYISNLNQTTYTVQELSEDTDYWWRVVAKDPESNATTSEIWTFKTEKTENNPPSEPVNPNPVDNGTEISRSPTLSWDAVTDPDDDAVSYVVYLDKSPSPATKRGEIAGTSLNISDLSYSTQYYWKVVAEDGRGGRTSSAVWHFTVQDAPEGEPAQRGLLIGVNDYGGGDSDLHATDDDARDIQTVLENFSNAYDVQLLTGTVNESGIVSELSAYSSNSTPEDIFFFHYSGHGYYANGESRLYLSNGGDMSMSELRTELDQINGTKVVVIDACESGGFANLVIGREMTRQERIENAERFREGVINAFREKTTSRGSYNSEYEYYVLTGSAINEYSNEDGNLNNGFLSFFFADGMGHVGENNPGGTFDYTYNADGYGPGGVNDSEITYPEIYHYSKDKVQQYIQSNYGETQTVQGNHTNSQFIIGEFSTTDDNPPASPSDPVPANNAENVSLNQSLSWHSSEADAYDIYFGASEEPPLVVSNQSFNSYNPGTLENNTTYYWQIVAANSNGTTTGPVWQFTTEDNTVSGTDAEVILRSSTPQITGDIEFDYLSSYFDTVNQNPPHWIVEEYGSLFFTFNGQRNFSFNAYGVKSWGNDAELYIYINDQLAYYGAIDQSWMVYQIPESDFTTGENTIEIYVTWGNMYIDKAWTGETETPESPPSSPSSPTPSNGAVIESQSPALSWTSSGATQYDVYFGADESPTLVSENQTGNDYSPQTLEKGSTYYWKIVAKNEYGETEGALWSFSVIDDEQQSGVDFESPYTGNYLLINNESNDGETTQYTGSLISQRRPVQPRKEFSMPRGLPLDAYRVDPSPDIDFDMSRDKIVNKTVTKRSVGDTKVFNTYNFKTGANEQITATLQAEGAHSKIWAGNTSEINTSRAQQMADEFDAVIYPAITGNFYTPSDVNNDGKVAILVYDIQDNFETTGSYTGGYFWAGDLYSIYEGSNEMEIFYIDTYPTMHYPKSDPVDVSKAYSTLAHEFQHMVNFNRNVLVEGTDSMSLWMDEGLSMAAEHLIYGPQSVSSRISYYNSSPGIRDGHSLLYWDSEGETLANYSLSYLFMQYVRTQMGQGNAIYGEIITDNANDYRAIQNVLNNYKGGKSFGDFMTDWRIAMVLKENTGDYGFEGEAAFNSITTPLYTGSSRNLRGGGGIIKGLTDAYSDPGNAGSSIEFVGIP